MATNKIIFDTNVLVAACIIENAGESNTVIKHEFYDQSIRLVSLLKRDNNCHGVLISTVKTEPYTVLGKAVYQVFVPDSLNDSHRRMLFYENSIALVASSEQKLDKLIGYLEEGEYDPEEMDKNIERVKSMSRDLRMMWKEKHSKKKWRKQESGKRAKTVLKEPRNQEQKEEVISAHDSQLARESLQLGRFVRKSNSRDELILAETISVMQFYEKTGDSYDFWIASCDSGFFAPYIRSYLGTSDTVTREIENRFKIRCDYPQKIYRLLS